MDAMGANIQLIRAVRYCAYCRAFMKRNEEWIGDKTRYAIDGLKRQRLDKPYIRNAEQADAGKQDEHCRALNEET